MKIGNFVTGRTISFGTKEIADIVNTVLDNKTVMIENVFHKVNYQYTLILEMYLNFMPKPVVIDNSTLSGVYKITAMFNKCEGFLEYNPLVQTKQSVKPDDNDVLEDHPVKALNDNGWKIFRKGTIQYSARFWVNGTSHIKGTRKSSDQTGCNINIRSYETELDDILISIESYLRTIEKVLDVKLTK